MAKELHYKSFGIAEAPKELFKYRAVNKYSLECLSEDMIWVSHPNSLNDPYEGSYSFDLDMSLEEVAARASGVDEVTIDNYLERQKELAAKVKECRPLDGFFCLCERNDVSLMWSHYADSHKGFCVGYGVNKSNDLGNGRCKKVTYGNHPRFSLRRIFQAADDKDEEFMDKVTETIILSKDINWSYEREWRLTYKKYDTLVTPRFSISSITFGMNMTEAHKKIIIKILMDKDIKYYQALRDHSSYNVNIVECEIV